MPKKLTWAALQRSNILYSATAKLSTKLCKTADVTSNLGSDLELSETIEYESLTSEVSDSWVQDHSHALYYKRANQIQPKPY